MKESLHKYIHSWDIASANFNFFKHPELSEDLEELDDLISYFEWQFELATIKDRLFDALVITDRNFEIQWVSSGFEKMTGYEPVFALHKTPKFLHGPETEPIKREDIAQIAKTGIPEYARVKNYKADGSVYICDIEIMPLYAQNDELSHYLAVEKEIR